MLFGNLLHKDKIFRTSSKIYSSKCTRNRTISDRVEIGEVSCIEKCIVTDMLTDYISNLLFVYHVATVNTVLVFHLIKYEQIITKLKTRVCKQNKWGFRVLGGHHTPTVSSIQSLLANDYRKGLTDITLYFAPTCTNIIGPPFPNKRGVTCSNNFAIHILVSSTKSVNNRSN